MTHVLDTFDKIWNAIRDAKDSYVPRNYQTMGGMWTVDTYRLNGVTAQMMDEGYTKRLITDTIMVTSSFIGCVDKITFEAGDEDELNQLAQQF